MKKLTTLLLVTCFVLASFGQDLASKIDSVVGVYARLYRFNGSVLVSKNGNPILAKGYGYRNAEKKILNDEKTIFHLASITKQFTAAIILKLQEEKKLDVHDKLSKYFPDFPRGDSITIEHLLTHTSGIYNWRNNGEFMANQATNPTNREKIMALFKDKPLDFSPGTNWSYSNSGYSLLGYIIEIVTKKPYQEVVRNYIFNPLQMTHSGFDFTHLNSPEKATGYFKTDSTAAAIAPIVDSSVSYSAGSIYSTVGDLFRWHKALQSNTILSKAQQERAYTPVRNNYGYGWGIDSLDGKRRVGHAGLTNGFVATLARIPEDDVFVVLLSNVSTPAMWEISNNIFSVLYNKPIRLPKERIAIKLPEEQLKQYVGEYEIGLDLHVVISVKNGELTALPTGQKESKLHAEKEDSFFVKEENIQLEFTRNDKKEVAGFTLYQGGATIQCKKIK